jgi:hypothetical protein
MGWQATATVQDVSDNDNPPVDILLTAEGDAITVDGDDQLSSIEVKLVSPVATHLVVGAQVHLTADC